MLINRLSCCNLAEISNLGYNNSHKGRSNGGLNYNPTPGDQTGEEILRKICLHMANSSYYNSSYGGVLKSNELQYIYPIYVFSGVDSYGEQGQKAGANKFKGYPLAEYIEEKDLGGIQKSDLADNESYHTGRKVVGFMWTPDQKKLKTWWKKQVADGHGHQEGKK